MDRGASDAELVAAARQGAKEAFEELVRRHAGRVYRLVLRMLGDPSAAEDETQEAFLRAWQGLARFRGDSSFSTWLFRIALNGADRRLGKDRRRASFSLEEMVGDLADHSAEASRRAESRELLAELVRALGELPPQHRVAVMLRDVEGLTNEEAAALLGLGLRNFKSRLHRGRMALRAHLEAAEAL